MEIILIVLGSIAFLFLLKIIFGIAAPKTGGKKLLKKYIMEQGYSIEIFPDSFFDECTERDFVSAKLEYRHLFNGEHWSTIFDKNLQNSAYQICMILSGEKNGFDDMRDRIKKYKVKI